MVTQSSVFVPSLLAAGAIVSFLIGRRLFLQLIFLSVAGFLATGRRYRWLYILYKTLPRDLMAVCRFAKVNLQLWWFENRNMTVPKVFTTLVEKHPNKVAFKHVTREWTFAEVDEFSNRVAHYFKSAGIARGETVALFMDSKPEYVCIWLGLSKLGVVTALINSNLRQSPLIHSIQVANTRAIIVGAELAKEFDVVREELPNMPVYQYTMQDVKAELSVGAIDLLPAILSSSSAPVDLSQGASRDKLLYIYTSGTTGLPKAAVITHLRFMFLSVGVHYMLNVQNDDVLYTPLPLYHTAGGMVGMGQILLFGCTMAIRTKFSASNFWPDCVTFKATVAQYIGEMCRYLLSVPSHPEEKQHQVRLIFGNGLRPQIWESFITRFGIKQVGEFYGATEGNSNLVNIDSMVGAVGFVPRYAGPIYPVALIRVDEETGEPIRGGNGLCMRCKPGEPGVFVGKINSKKAISTFSGYADRKATEKKIVHDVFARGDQVFNSGDILVMDEFGYFYFKDRTGDTFRWRGENVATSEVEAVVSNVAGLKDAVVFGVEVPNVEGRAGMAAILDTDGSLDLVQFAKGVQDHLPSYARPLFIRVLSELEMTGTYKLKKRDLQSDGFNPHKIKDSMYFLSGGQYVPLTLKLYDDIVCGRVRL